MADALARETFAPCGATQPVAAGFVPPRGLDHSPLVESVADQWLLTLLQERKLLPSSVLRDEVQAQARRIEAETGRKPGKRQLRELKDQAQQALLPQAFTKQSRFKIWIAPKVPRLMLDASSAARAEELVTLLIQALPGLALRALQTNLTPATAMAGWLLENEAPPNFSVDRECELKADDESKAVVRYARHHLDTDEVCQHIGQGKRPTRLALTWRGRVSLVLADSGAVRKIDSLDVLFEGRSKPADEHEAFDADLALASGELSRLIPDLIDALGGLSSQALPPPDALVAAAMPETSEASATSPPWD